MRSLNETNGPSGPFEKALRTFATGGPIPLVVGAFGETNRELDKIVVMMYVSTASSSKNSIWPTTLS
jgi:hypothetical protein